MAERDRWEQLRLLERAGSISGLQRQPAWTFPIRGEDGRSSLLTTASGRPVRYTADFAYWDVERGCRVCEDVKGVLTRDAALRISLLKAVWNIEVLLTKAPRAPRRRR